MNKTKVLEWIGCCLDVNTVLYIAMGCKKGEDAVNVTRLSALLAPVMMTSKTCLQLRYVHYNKVFSRPIAQGRAWFCKNLYLKSTNNIRLLE